MNKTSDVDFVKLGDTVTYTITIPNTGNVSANNVVLYDTIPSGTTFVSNSASVNGSIQGGSNPGTTGVQVGTIAPGASSVVQFKVLVVSVPANGKILNQASTSYSFTVDPSNPDGRTGKQISNIDTVTVTQASIVGPPGTAGANNNGTKVGDKSPVDIGDTVTYTISLYNSGNVPAYNVSVSDTVPTCTTLVNGSVKVNGTATANQISNILVGTIAAGQTAVVNYSVKVTCLPTPPPAVLVNQANISYQFTTDPTKPPTTVTGPTNPSTIPVTTASFGPLNGQSGIIKSVDKAYADRGDTITYTINLTNLGNTVANNVVFSDTVPNDTLFIMDSLSVNGTLINGANPGTGVSLGSIQAGASAQVIFKVQVLTVPNPNPIPNAALVNFTYTVNPSLPDGKVGASASNIVNTKVNTAIIGPPGAPGTSGGSGVLKTASPSYADIGTTVTYTLALTNTGNTVAKNVVAFDTIAIGSVFIAGSVYVNGANQPGATPETGMDIGNINPGMTATVTFKTMTVSIPPSKSLTDTPSVDYSYTVDPSLPDVNTTGGGNTVTIPVNNANISPTDGGLNKSASPSYVTVGTTITYTIALKNTGSVSANSVTVFDTLQNGIVFIPGTVKFNGGTLGAANPTTGINVGTLNPNILNTLTFNAVVSTMPNPNPISNTANVSYNYNPAPGVIVPVTNPTNTTTTPANLGKIDNVNKTSNVDFVKLGDIVTYTITIPNIGNVAVDNVVLYDTIPGGTTFVSNSVSVNGTIQGGANPGTTGVQVGTIAPSASSVVQFNVLVVSVPASGKLLNQASMSYNYTIDPSNPGGGSGKQISNIDTVTVTQASIVGPPGTAGANNKGTKVGDKSPVDIGDTVTYTISLYNSGNVPAYNVSVSDTVPNCTTLVNGSVKVNGTTTANQISNILVGTIPAGQTAVVNYSVKVTCLPTPAPAVLVNQANISYQFTTDPTKPPTTVTGPTNPSTIPVTTASFGFINGQNGLIKSVDKAYADKGDTITYTINLTNLGNTNANNVVFSDTVPNDTSFVQNSLTVNGIVVNGASPTGGVTLGTIAPGGSAQVIFKVIVLTVPNPNPVPNSAVLNYTYTVNPSIPDGKIGKNLSNGVLTQVNTAIIGTPGAPGTKGGSGVLKTASPMNADIGTTVTYTMVLTNTGNTVAKNVVVFDSIAAGSTFINDSVTINGAASLGTNPQTGVNVGNIAAGNTVTVTFKTMTVSIPPSKTLTDTPSVNYSYSVDPSLPDTQVTGGGNTVTIPVNHASISTTDGGFVKLQNPNYSTVGDTVTYTMVLKNTGSVNATNVTVYDNIDASLKFVPGSVTVNGTTQGVSNPATGIIVGILSPNSVATVTFKALVITVPNPNPIKNQANVSYQYKPDPNTVVTVTNPSNITTEQINYVDITKMSKSSNTDFVKLLDVVTYTITIPNNGNVSADFVTLYDTIPGGTTFVTNSATVNGITMAGQNPQTTGIQVGTIAPNTSAVVQFKVTVTSIPASGVLLNQAAAGYEYTVDPSVPDGRSGAGISNVVTTTVTQASIVGPPGTAGANNNGTKVGTPSPVDIGDTVTYTISLYNSGNVPAINVLVADTLPTCTSLVNGSVKINGNVTSYSSLSNILVGTIAAGQTATVNYSVKVMCLPSKAPASLVNQANVSYGFITDPTKPPTTVTGPTNPSTIPVITASFGNINGQNGMIKTVDKAYGDRGSILTYTIKLTNLGNTNANNVVFNDTVPNDTSYVQDSLTVNGNPVNGANPGTGVTLGTIAPGATDTIIFKVQVLTIPNPNPIPNSGVVNYTYTVNPSLPDGRVGANLSNTVLTKVNSAVIGYPGAPGTTGGSGVLKTASPMNADIGTTVTYTLVLTNTGNTTAKNVVVYDTIANGSTFINNSVTINGTASLGSNPQTGIDVGNIAAGNTVTVMFSTMTVSLPLSHVLVDTPRVDYSYTVDPASPDVQISGGGNTVTIPVNHASISPTDGGFVKSQNPSYATIGDTITYTMVLKNTGSVDATGVTVYDNLDPALQFVSGSVLVNNVSQVVASPASGIVVGVVSPNAIVTVSFKALVTTVPNPNPIKNTATVKYQYKPDPNTVVSVTNPSNTTTGQINYVDISKMSKSSNPNFVKIGDTITYTITIPNNGNVSASNVVFFDTIPTNTTFVTGSVTVNGLPQVSANPGTTGVNVGTIAPNSSAVVKFAVQVNCLPPSGSIQNQASANYKFTVDPSVPDGRSGSGISNVNSVTVADAIVNGNKSADKKVVDIGDTITYTIVISNTGNVPAFNMIVNDTIPPCTTLVNGSVTVNGLPAIGTPNASIMTSQGASIPSGVVQNTIPSPCYNMINGQLVYGICKASSTMNSGIFVGTVPANSVATVQYTVKVTCLPTITNGLLVNKANINYNFITDPSTGPNTKITQTNAVTIPVVTAGFGTGGFVKSVSSDCADIGDTITYTIVLTNNGNTTADNVVFRDTIPSGTQFIQGSVMIDGVSASSANPTSGINLGNISAGAVKTIQFKALVLQIPTPNPITNQGKICYSYTTDPSIPDGRSTIELSNVVSTQINNAMIGKPVAIANPIGSGVVKSATPMIASIGDTITYTLVVTNTGNVVAQNVVVNDTIAQGSVFIQNSVTVDSVPVSNVNPQTGISLGNICPGDTRTITFKTLVTSLPTNNVLVDTPVVNYGYGVCPSCCASIKTQIAGGNTVTIPVNTAIIGTTKSGNPSYVTVGDTITYTIVAKNSGSISASCIKVLDTLQNGVMFVPGSVYVNGVNTPSSSPLTGIPVTPLSPNGVATVTFTAVVTTTPNPNPVVNVANTVYCFSKDGNTVTTVTTPSNPVTTPVNFIRVDGMTKTANVNYAAVGDYVTYTIGLPNLGNTNATGVVLYDSIPNGAMFVQDSAKVDGFTHIGENPSTTGINVGTISPNQIVTVMFTVMVMSIPNNGHLINVANANFNFTVDPSNPNSRKTTAISNINSVTVVNANIVGPLNTVGASNGGSKTSDKVAVDENEVVTYTIQLFNSGNVPANNVILKDTIPNGTAFISNSVIINGASQPGVTPGTGIIVGTINPGQTVDVVYKVITVSLPASGKLINTADVSYSFIKDPGMPQVVREKLTNTNTVLMETATFGNLNGKTGIVKVVDKSFATVGDIINYTVTMTNLGNVDATNVKFVDTIPNGTSFVQDSLLVNGVAQFGANPSNGVSLGTIKAGQTVNISFKATAINVPVPNPITNQSYASYNYVVGTTTKSNKDFSNAVQTKINYAVIGNQINLGEPCGTGIVKSADKPVVDIGDVITYTLVLTNTGNVDAENVIAYDTIPVGTTFVPNSIMVNGNPMIQGSPFCPQNAANITVTPENGMSVGNIAPGSSATVTFKVLVTSIPTNGSVVNTPSVNYNYTVDPAAPGGAIGAGGGNTITIPLNTAVIQNSNGGLIKSVDKAYAGINEIVTYTISLKNTGTVDATGTKIFDTIPDGTNFVMGSVSVDGIAQNAKPDTGIIIGTVKPGQTRIVTFKVQVVAVPDVNPMPNSTDVTYGYNTGLVQKQVRNTSNKVTTKVNYINFQGATKTVDKKYADVGDTLTYTIALPNSGNVAAVDVFFSDKIAQGTAFVPDSLSVNGIMRPGTSPEIGLNVGNIAPNQTLTVQFKVQIL